MTTTPGKLHLSNLRTTHLFCIFHWLIFFIVINTCFVLWIFLLWLTYIFLIVIDHCEEKLALWYIVKCDSIEWLFTDYFCLIIWYSTEFLHLWAVAIFVMTLGYYFILNCCNFLHKYPRNSYCISVFYCYSDEQK